MSNKELRRQTRAIARDLGLSHQQFAWLFRELGAKMTIEVLAIIANVVHGELKKLEAEKNNQKKG